MSSPTPVISVVIPTFNRPEELRLCLEGFRQQTVKQDQFEVIVVDDGSTLEAESSVFASVENLKLIRSEHAGPGVARNIAIKLAQAPLLILYDDDLRPLPDLIEYCLDFHRLHPAEQDMALLRFGPDPATSGLAFAEWAFGKLYPFPQVAVVGGWGHFWSGTITMKKSIFRYGLFDPAYRMAEDTELGLRLSRSVKLRIRYEPRLTGTLTRRVTFEQICWRQYTLGYFSCILARHYRDVANFAHPPYDDPEPYVIKDRDRLMAMVASARGLEAHELNGNGSSSARASKLLDALWSTAELHARAEGWLAARDHQPLQPPGTLGLVFQP
jgi:glycosyltransferase involved in cell wall biosynthesis